MSAIHGCLNVIIMMMPRRRVLKSKAKLAKVLFSVTRAVNAVSYQMLTMLFSAVGHNSSAEGRSQKINRIIWDVFLLVSLFMGGIL